MNFAHLMSFQKEKYHKKQYNHAHYFSPEQIERNEDNSVMQSGDIWNVGVITYAFYQGDFPFMGDQDSDIISAIIQRPNNWTPAWKEGV